MRETMGTASMPDRCREKQKASRFRITNLPIFCLPQALLFTNGPKKCISGRFLVVGGKAVYHEGG